MAATQSPISTSSRGSGAAGEETPDLGARPIRGAGASRPVRETWIREAAPAAPVRWVPMAEHRLRNSTQRSGSWASQGKSRVQGFRKIRLVLGLQFLPTPWKALLFR